MVWTMVLTMVWTMVLTMVWTIPCTAMFHTHPLHASLATPTYPPSSLLPPPHPHIPTHAPPPPTHPPQHQVRNYATRRFGFQAEEVAPFEQYLYNILAADGSGEFALRHILEPFAWPRVALEERLPVGIQGVGEGVGGVQGDGEATTTGGGKGGGNGHGGVQHSTQQNTLNNTVNNNDSTVSTNNNNSAFATIPISFIYGEHDWMDPKHGARVCQQLKQLRTPLNGVGGVGVWVDVGWVIGAERGCVYAYV